MSKLTTSLAFELSAPLEQMEEQLRKLLPKEYKLTKATFSGAWEIKNGRYQHSLYYYYEKKNGKLNTVRRDRFLFAASLIVGFLFYLFSKQFLLDFWRNDYGDMLLIVLVLLVCELFDPILNHLHPQRKTKMEEEHQKILVIAESLEFQDSTQQRHTTNSL